MDLGILDAYQERSKALDLEGIDWGAVRAHPLPSAAHMTWGAINELTTDGMPLREDWLDRHAVD